MKVSSIKNTIKPTIHLKWSEKNSQQSTSIKIIQCEKYGIVLY